MPLMRRPRADVEWPDWLGMRRWFDWPESFSSLSDEGGMSLEEFTEDDTLVVRAELPGIDPEKDVEITVRDDTLRIRAERRQETRTEDKAGYRSEFRYGSFVRAVRLPAGATDEDVAATYHDGILEVRVPVSTERAEAKTIPIRRG